MKSSKYRKQPHTHTSEGTTIKVQRSVLLTQYHSGYQTEKNKMGVACRKYGERRGSYRVLVGKLGRPRRRWEDNIMMDLQEVG
jgi:hypothetical protein